MKIGAQRILSLPLAAWAVIALLCCASLRAQSTYTGQISGEVTDPSGAVIAGAKVTLTDDATNVQTSATTDSKGVYVLTSLRPATYTILVEAPNLASVERKDVVLAVSQQANAEFHSVSRLRNHQRDGLGSGSAAGYRQRFTGYRRHQRICTRYPADQSQFFRTGLSLRRRYRDRRSGYVGFLPLRDQLRLQRAA